MFRWTLRTAVLLLALGLGLRAVLVARGPGLEPWHTVVPEEPPREAVARMSWEDYRRAEEAMLARLRSALEGALRPGHRSPANRFHLGGPLDPAQAGAPDWNRSQLLLPDGAPRGAALLLHGLTDAPYSMRHLAGLYRAAGWAAVVPRLPGHGTVPAGLAHAVAEDWRAAARMALREAQARAGAGPVHILGYSNGGALALDAVLDALAEGRRPPARIVLLSPMVGVTAFARFAGVAGWPAALPRFAAAAWLGIEPEFNPYKYNSFPVNAARQSHRLSSAVRSRLATENLRGFPPVLVLQSAVDATVSTAAIVSGLLARLPENGSELILFDINRAAPLGPLVAPGVELALERLVPAAPRRWTLTLVTNAAPGDAAAVARQTPAGRDMAMPDEPLGVAWPPGLFSLSHVALPFPPGDGLYGLEPDAADMPGLPRLGSFAARGERGVLVLPLDVLLRATSNPFWPLVARRVLDGMAAR